MFYLIVFFILLSLSLLNLQYTDRLSRQVLLPVTALILIAVAGLRYETGGDWDTYTKFYKSFPYLSEIITNPSLLFKQHLEKGFVLLCSLVKSLGGTIQHLFFIVTFINISLIASILPKYTKYPVIALFCYYCILYFNLEMIYIRQATAVALSFYALQFVHSRKVWQYLALVLIACLFHRMAIIMLPLYFLLDKQLPSWVYLTIVGCGALLMILGVPWIKTVFLTIANWLGDSYADKAEFYTEKALFATSRRLSIGFWLNLALLGCIMFFHGKIKTNTYGTIMLNMFALSLVIYYYCYELVEVSNRLRLFFNIGIIALLPMLLEIFPLFKDRIIAFAVISLYCFSFSRGIFTEAPEAAAYNPYQNYIEYKINPRPSTGKQRLNISKKAFRQERKR